MNSILVIDDDPVVCEVMRQVLEHDGYRVATAGDGQSGLCDYAQLNPDVVIVDILMPGKEGIATILELREGDPDARIIAMTGGGGFNSVEVLRIAELVGADNSLAKPFRPAELVASVKRCLAA
jgi:DNA-binding response OmpR family regulator